MQTKYVLFAVAVAVSVGCAGRKAAWNEGSGDAPAGTGQTPAATGTPGTAPANSAIAEGDAMWEQRTSAENIRAALAHWERAAKAEPGNVDLLVKLTRGHYFLADGYLRDNEKEYLRVMDQGVEWGEKAMIAASPEFGKMMRDGEKYPKAVQAVPVEGVPAMYWYASALGKWAKRKGFAVLLGQKDNVKATMDRALALQPDYYYGGPPRYFGAFYAIAPGFAGGDLEKSKASFEQSLKIEPNFVGTKVLWAGELAVKVQDEETFDRLLAEVLATPDDVIPEVRPETIVEKQKAKELIAQKSDLF